MTTPPRRLSRVEIELPDPEPHDRDLDRELAELTYARDLGLFTDDGTLGPMLAGETPDDWHTVELRHTGSHDCRRCWERAHTRLRLFTAYVRQLLDEVPEARALGAQEPPVWMHRLDAEHGWEHHARTGQTCMSWEDACDLIADRGAPWEDTA